MPKAKLEMTDLEKFVELYKSFGVDVVVDSCEVPGERLIHLTEGGMFNSGEGWTEDDRFKGYCDFFTTVSFDEDGKFVSQGFYE